MIASRRFPATWHEYDALCFIKKNSFCGFSTSDVGLCLVQSGLRVARRKQLKNVPYFPQEVSCGTNEAFAQNSTRDCTYHMQADHATNVI